MKALCDTSIELSKKNVELVANTIRVLAAEGVEAAKSGHPGMPMGMAELGAVLWLKYLSHASQDPEWIARDRFVLSNGHGSMFIYSMLHLSGYDVSIDDLRAFRQLDSKTPGHPENFMTSGVETTTGPLGQGVANAVGMALGQKLLAAKYGDGSFNPVDHTVWCFCGDGCLMEGVSSEASSVAGHLGLDNLVVVYDDNKISIAGHTNLAFTEDVEKRYQAYGWNVIRIDGHNHEEIDNAYAQALAHKGQPTMIMAATTIGKGSPNKANTHGVHGSALGAEEAALTKKELGWPEEAFFVPSEVTDLFSTRAKELEQHYSQWQSKYSAWKASSADVASALEAQIALDTPDDLEEQLLSAIPQDGKPIASRKLSYAILQAASKAVPSLIGGSADLEPSNLTLIAGEEDVQKEQFAGKNIRYGVREHGMGAINKRFSLLWRFSTVWRYVSVLSRLHEAYGSFSCAFTSTEFIYLHS